MDFNEFSMLLASESEKIGIKLTDEKISRFYTYMKMLLEWNEKMNLTAITEPKEVILKHFVDSITIEKYLKAEQKIIDVGTGAGFPGIPLKIVRDDVDITLMDSLNKRINFLNEVIIKTEIKNIETVHARAEELARDKKYREEYDVATSRAVAPLNVLLEYMLPFVKKGGYCICMKGPNVEEELKNAKNALEKLNGEIETVDKFFLNDGEFGRNIVIIKKVGSTPAKYPRKAGTPSKEPL